MNVKNLSQNFRQAMAKSVLIAAALLVWSSGANRGAGYFRHR